MKTHTHPKGSALVTVLMLTMAVALMAGALIAYTVLERRLNRHGLLLLQAQDAARAVLEYGASQAAVTFVGIPQKQLQTFLSANASTLNLYTTRDSGLFPTGTSAQYLNDFPVTTDPDHPAGNGSYSLALYGSNLLPSPAANFTFTTGDPRNTNDPLAGQTVSAQNLYLLAQATASDVNGNSVTDYAIQAIQVRYSSIFNYAIFYNVPLELAPSDEMDIYGPVFSNAAVYLNSSNTAANHLVFHSTFDTASTFTASSIGAEAARPGGQNIYFPNKASPVAEVNILNPTVIYNTISYPFTASYVDSNLNKAGAANQSPAALDTAYDNATGSTTGYLFTSAANYLWGGNVQDQNNVQAENPPGIVAAALAQGFTAAQTAQAAQELIETPAPPKTPNPAATSPLTYDPVEAQKFATQAGLYIVVTPNNNGTTTGASVVAFYGTPANNFQNALYYLYAAPNIATPVKNTAAQRTAWLNPSSSTTWANLESTNATNINKVLFSNGSTPGTINGVAGSTITNTLAGIVKTTRLFYDPREQQPVNVVDIDVGALALAIGTTNGINGSPAYTQEDPTTLTCGVPSTTPAAAPALPGLWDIDGLSTSTDNEQPWNGLVYVDVETDVPGAAVTGWQTTSDVVAEGNNLPNGSSGVITGTGQETVVRLVDGGNTTLGLYTNATLPSRPNLSNGNAVGFSLTSNAPIYVLGNYNTDGTMPGEPTPSNTNVMSPDFDQTPRGGAAGSLTLPAGAQASLTVTEVPAMVAGDAINILSNAWWSGTPSAGAPIGDGDVTHSDGTHSTAINEQNAAPTDEIAAGFITGNVPTTTAPYSYSGGVENYFRLEEQWGGSVLRVRGSMIGLYNSSVATGAWPGTGGQTYSAPGGREWGYDNMFGVSHVYPPGAPVIVTLRRLNYTDINLAQFNAYKTNTTYNFTLQH